jgi:hypothetical protein
MDVAKDIHKEMLPIGAHHILHIRRIRVKKKERNYTSTLPLGIRGLFQGEFYLETF